ncbi:hypothetical protein BCR42DRAFT_200240 [Absidia repens]|uniref:Uncharacterized protein n=1 Tax=Absidia repens TaxID=90262 RepID=A0A1X2HRA3_9FUNG|nr:hypothetical protein BCR42DRAFT_200240 [Absidia repens]
MFFDCYIVHNYIAVFFEFRVRVCFIKSFFLSICVVVRPNRKRKEVIMSTNYHVIHYCLDLR